MMQSGQTDLPLHNGKVPQWLAIRMATLGRAIMESLVIEYGHLEVLRRLSDPLWFQALGCVLGMDWHSSGITTSVMGALKRAINPISNQLGIIVCGGRGKHSRQTPNELLALADRTGLDGTYLVRCSKLSAKVDNTAIQDGFQIYLHSFVVTKDGDWSVIQQGMNPKSGMARRYHWHSGKVTSFVKEPHSAICGPNLGKILNLVDAEAACTQSGMLSLAKEEPKHILPEIKKICMPRHHDVKQKDVDLKRLGSILALAHDHEVGDFESLLLLKGMGPRTIQSLALVSEIIHGTPSRFTDPARFSFAHGGKDGHPFPVPLKIYDETISTLRGAVSKAKIGNTDKSRAIKSLSQLSERIEKNFVPNSSFEKIISKERNESLLHGGMTVSGMAQPRKPINTARQLELF